MRSNRHINESTNTGKFRERTKQAFKDAVKILKPDISDTFFEKIALKNHPDYEVLNPDGLNMVDWQEKNFAEEFFHEGHGGVHQTVRRLEPIFMKLAIIDGAYLYPSRDNKSEDKLDFLRNFITFANNDVLSSKKENRSPLIKLSDITENISLIDLYRSYGKLIEKFQEDESKEIETFIKENNITPNKHYKIIKDVDYETAHKIGEYSCPTSKLCYTQEEKTWNQYTKDGKNTVYVCLRDDWKTVPEEPGENTPYDDYGLSMIFICVSPQGKLLFSNTRWNHKHGVNVDHSFTKMQLSKLLGVNFDKVFVPRTKEEQEPLFKDDGGFYNNLKKIFSEKFKLNDILRLYYQCRYDNGYGETVSLHNEGEPEFLCGWCMVCCIMADRKMYVNFIDKDYNFLLGECLTRVKENNKRCYIDSRGFVETSCGDLCVFCFGEVDTEQGRNKKIVQTYRIINTKGEDIFSPEGFLKYYDDILVKGVGYGHNIVVDGIVSSHLIKNDRFKKIMGISGKGMNRYVKYVLKKTKSGEYVYELEIPSLSYEVYKGMGFDDVNYNAYEEIKEHYLQEIGVPLMIDSKGKAISKVFDFSNIPSSMREYVLGPVNKTSNNEQPHRQYLEGGKESYKNMLRNGMGGFISVR